MENRIEGIRLSWKGSGFGNALVVAQITKILIDNNVPAVFHEHKTVRGLVDVPLYNDSYQHFYLYTKPVVNTQHRKNVDEPVVIKYLKDIGKLLGRKISLLPDHTYIPVNYKEIPDIKGVDVVLCTKTGRWCPYRDWPYFKELKKEFDKLNITYIDLNKEKIKGNECLNYVKKSKLYLGLDTGTSHYVSKFANGKTLIIQSGFNIFSWWSHTYDYDVITANVECDFRPCFINMKDIAENNVCPFDVSCMKNIKVKHVLYEVQERLK